MREWLIVDVFLMFVFVGLMISAYSWNVKDKNVATRFYTTAIIVVVFVIGNILYFNIFKRL